MTVKYVLVGYRGANPRYSDNVLNARGRVWNGPGSTVRIPENEAMAYYVNHPDVFYLVTPLFLQSPAAEAMSTDDQMCALLHIASVLEDHACEQLQVALAARRAELGAPDLTPQLPASGEEASRFALRKEAVRSALDRLDPDPENTRDWTDLGKPRLKRVKELSGIDDLTADEVAVFKRQRPA